MTLYVDVHEPKKIVSLLKQDKDLDVQVIPTVPQAKADYFWIDPDGLTIQVERKQWQEILNKFDKVEDQLDRERVSADRTYLLIEGLYAPKPTGVTSFEVKWLPQPRSGEPRHWFRKQWDYPKEIRGRPQSKPQISLQKRTMSWLDSLDRAGISIIQTPDLASTALQISILYWNTYRENFRAFQRYIRPQVVTSSRHGGVRSLMGLVGAGLGQVRAEALIEAFDTVYDVITAPEEQLAAVIGDGYMTKFLTSIGRTKGW